MCSKNHLNGISSIYTYVKHEECLIYHDHMSIVASNNGLAFASYRSKMTSEVSTQENICFWWNHSSLAFGQHIQIHVSDSL